MFFFLEKKNQKFKTICQPPFTPQKLPGMAGRTELTKPATLLPTYDKLDYYV
jgi:hypothetical protein